MPDSSLFIVTITPLIVGRSDHNTKKQWYYKEKFINQRLKIEAGDSPTLSKIELHQSLPSLQHDLEMIENSLILTEFRPDKYEFPRAYGPRIQIQIHMQASL